MTTLRLHEARLDWLDGANATAAALVESTGWLRDDERHRVERLAREHARRDFVLGRWLLRRALQRWSGIPAATWSFLIGPHGRPVPQAPGVPPELAPRVNLSHGGGLVVCASARAAEVGVDVEATTREVPAGVLERFFAAAEIEDLARLEAAARRDRFWRLWTLKEAWLKARGTGIAGSLASFEVRFRDPEPPRLHGPDDAASWVLFEHRPTPGHRIAVAARAADGSGMRFLVTRVGDD